MTLRKKLAAQLVILALLFGSFAAFAPEASAHSKCSWGDHWHAPWNGGHWNSQKDEYWSSVANPNGNGSRQYKHAHAVGDGWPVYTVHSATGWC